MGRVPRSERKKRGTVITIRGKINYSNLILVFIFSSEQRMFLVNVYKPIVAKKILYGRYS